MAMVVLTGYIVATSPPVARIIDRIATVPSSARGAVAFVALMSCLVSMLNWGLSLVFSGLLARAIARRPDLRADYRALGAAAYMGLGAVWALGFSSSAAQLQATAESLLPELLKITGVLGFGDTILTWQSLSLAAVLIVLTVVVAYASAPQGGGPFAPRRTWRSTSATPSTRRRPARAWGSGSNAPGSCRRSSVCSRCCGWSSSLPTTPSSPISSLDTYLLVFLVLGLGLHKTPRAFLDATAKAVPTTAGVLVQYPLYAGMAAVLTQATGRGGVSVSEHLANLFTDLGGSGGFAVVIAVYTAFLGILCPRVAASGWWRRRT